MYVGTLQLRHIILHCLRGIRIKLVTRKRDSSFVHAESQGQIYDLDELRYIAFNVEAADRLIFSCILKKEYIVISLRVNLLLP
jgi:hypothetical protein